MNQLVFIKENKVVTDSLTVSEVFKKAHDKVVRDIKVQISKLQEAGEQEWSTANFGESQYQHQQNKQWYTKFDLSEDAFAIIAMSYVTPEAMKMKIKFLNEFKRMKEQLENKFGLPTTYKEALAKLLHEVEEKEQLQIENKVYQQQISEYEPKANYVDEILKSRDAILISQIAEDYGRTAQQMNKLLNKMGIQYKMGNQWLLYSKHKGKGYTKSETTKYTKKDGSKGVSLLTKWTQKGRLFLYEFLRTEGILPTMEQMKMEFYLDQKEGAKQ